MEEKEIMTNEEIIVETEEGTNESSGIGAGMGFIIGALVTAAGIVAVKKVKKVIANHKAKKERTEVVCSCNESFDDEEEDSEE